MSSAVDLDNFSCESLTNILGNYVSIGAMILAIAKNDHYLLPDVCLSTYLLSSSTVCNSTRSPELKVHMLVVHVEFVCGCTFSNYNYLNVNSSPGKTEIVSK